MVDVPLRIMVAVPFRIMVGVPFRIMVGVPFRIMVVFLSERKKLRFAQGVGVGSRGSLDC